VRVRAAVEGTVDLNRWDMQLHAGFRAMCNKKADEVYRGMLPRFVEEFNQVTAVIRSVGMDLESQGRSELASCVRRFQELEHQKLTATMHLHALRKAHAFEDFEWQQDAAAPLSGTSTAHTLGAGVPSRMLRQICLLGHADFSNGLGV
jgi:hypothetical protein